jgi:hypothetical protein
MLQSIVPLLAAVVVALLPQPSSAASLSLDRGWRFQLGSAGGEQMSCETGAANAFDSGSLEGWLCPAWPRLGFGDAWRTEAECFMYCCSEPSCIGYLYNATKPNTCGRPDGCTPTCLVGGSMAGCHKAGPDDEAGYTGGRKRAAVPALIPQPPAAGPQTTGFDDSHWRQVDAPHDFIIESNPDPVRGGRNHFDQNGVENDWSHGCTSSIPQSCLVM